MFCCLFNDFSGQKFYWVNGNAPSDLGLNARNSLTSWKMAVFYHYPPPSQSKPIKLPYQEGPKIEPIIWASFRTYEPFLKFSKSSTQKNISRKKNQETQKKGRISRIKQRIEGGKKRKKKERKKNICFQLIFKMKVIIIAVRIRYL